MGGEDRHTSGRVETTVLKHTSFFLSPRDQVEWSAMVSHKPQLSKAEQRSALCGWPRVWEKRLAGSNRCNNRKVFTTTAFLFTLEPSTAGETIPTCMVMREAALRAGETGAGSCARAYELRGHRDSIGHTCKSGFATHTERSECVFREPDNRQQRSCLRRIYITVPTGLLWLWLFLLRQNGRESPLVEATKSAGN